MRTSRLAPLDAMLFDLDGTLVESDLDFPAMKARVLDLAHGHGARDPALDGLDILGCLEQAAIALERDRVCHPFRAQAEAALAAFEVPAGEACRELGGSVEALRDIRNCGIRIGIVTRNCRAAVDCVLRRVPLAHDLLLTRNDVRDVKPHPEHLLTAARALRVLPGRTVMIGDHPLDVAAGRAAGMETIGLLPHGRSPDRFADAAPDFVAQSVQEIVRWI